MQYYLLALLLPILLTLNTPFCSFASLTCDKESSSFVNICGLCVGGSSGMEDMSGLDDCGICFGSNDCLLCEKFYLEDGCQKCHESSKNCTLGSSIFPSKVDLASGLPDVHVILKDSSITNYNFSDVECKIYNSKVSNSSNKQVKMERSSIDHKGIHITINRPSFAVGSYIVECTLSNSDSKRALASSMDIVDSRSLKIQSFFPEKVPVDTFFQAQLNLPSISEEQDDILCFLIVNDQVEMIVKAEVVSHKQIKCKPMIARSSSRVSVGVSETLEAIINVPTSLSVKEIVIETIGPVMRRSSFSTDLCQIHVQFDKNIESEKACSEAFSEDTQKLFGKGWRCWIKANEIVILLGMEPEVQPGSRISITSESGIKTLGSFESSDFVSAESAIIVDDVANQVIEPHYSVLAPQAVCYASRSVGFQSALLSRSSRRNDVKESLSNEKSVTVVEVQELGGQNLVYNWSVNFEPSKYGNSKVFWSQRDMLMIWLSVRLLDKSVKRISTNKVVLNNSLMLSGVDYTISVRGSNSLGMFGEEKQIALHLSDKPTEMEHRSRKEDQTFSACSSGFPLDVMLLSSPASFADAECWIELSLSCCDGVLISEFFSHVEYIWSVRATNGHYVNVMYNHGKRLVIPPNTLQGGNHYNVSCDITHKASKKVIGSASTSLVILKRGIKTSVNVSAITLSTKHPLILDASRSIDLDNKPGNLEFVWSCRIITETSGSFNYGDKQCYVPGAKKILLSEKYRLSFSKPLLWLPPGSLSIGRYLFSVEVTKQPPSSSQNDFVSTEVNVVGGSPPLMSLESRNTFSNENFPTAVINPEEEVSISGFASGIKPGCTVLWTVVNKPGCSPLNQSFLQQEKFISTVYDNTSREFPVELSHGMTGDSKYCLRLSATCPSLQLGAEVSSVDFELKTDAPPIVKPLKVEPLEGQALITLFKFYTEPAYDDLLDCPLRYSFGFRVIDPLTSNPNSAKFFHSTSQHLSTSTYLPAVSLDVTKIQTLLRVCDVRHICHTEEGPQVSTSAPTNLTLEQVERLSDNFASLLLTEEYEDAVMIVESSMATLGILDNKSLYELASQRVEGSINSQLEVIEEKLDGSVGSVYAALRFLKVANAALKQGSFSKSTIRKLVAFKDKVLSMFSSFSGRFDDRHVELRVKRESPKPQKGVEQTWSILQPEMVKALLSISEVAILNLNDSRGALDEKRKLLQNVSFFMDSLCRGLRNPTPLFIGSRVVSFSIQRLNLQVKYRDDLAVPDWRSAKSGGAPINATAMVLLGENVLNILGRDPICMGAAFYPIDFLSDVFGKFAAGSYRHSAVYQVRLTQETKGLPRNSFSDSYDGLHVRIQSIQIKIPIWRERISSEHNLECRVWHKGEWSGLYCKLTKFVTLLNKPAVECLCSILGYHAVFAVESPQSTEHTPVQSSDLSTVLSSSPSPSLPASSTPPSTFPPITVKAATETSSNTQPEFALPEGTPISNTSQNFTFRIQEDFYDTVGTHREDFISQLKQDILKQVDMPANMIAGIDVNPGSILVTLHLVDTDIRTVNDVLPTLAAVLQEGRLSVSGVDGRHLSVPPQSLQLLQRRSEHSFLPLIVIGCASFSVLCICSFLIAAVIVTRKRQQAQYSKDTPTPEVKTQVLAYGRFHLEQTLDGSEATISRYRSSSNNPLVVSTIGGMASVMGTNAKIPDSYQAASLQYKLQPPQVESRCLSTPKESCNTNSNSGSGTQSSSSGSNSMSSVQRRMRTPSVHKRLPSTEDRKPILNSEEDNDDLDEDDSGIIINDGAKISNGGNHLSEASIGKLIVAPPEVPILPGTPTGKDSEPPSM